MSIKVQCSVCGRETTSANVQYVDIFNGRHGLVCKSLSDYVDKNYKAMLWYEFICHGSIQPHIDDAPHHFPRGYKKVVFRLGYQRNAPSMTFEVRDICFGKGRPEWGAPTDKEVFIIKLGKRIII